MPEIELNLLLLMVLLKYNKECYSAFKTGRLWMLTIGIAPAKYI